MERGIRNSAKALILRDGKLLALRMQDADGVFYILPGGGQQTEELLPQAAAREAAEELGLRRAIMALDAGIPHPIYLGNENMGDPEITD